MVQINSLWPSHTIWRHRLRSTLVQVMARCLTASSHYLNQCWLIISEVQWHSLLGQFLKRWLKHQSLNLFENYVSKISCQFPRGQWVNGCLLPISQRVCKLITLVVLTWKTMIQSDHNFVHHDSWAFELFVTVCWFSSFLAAFWLSETGRTCRIFWGTHGRNGLKFGMLWCILTTFRTD